MDNKLKNCLALFDFDGTLTTADSYLAFFVFAFGLPRFIFKIILLIPIIVLYKLQIIPNYKAKEIVTTAFLKGWSFEKFVKVSKAFSDTQIIKILNRQVYEKLTWHKNYGHKVVIVTASFYDYLEPWCQKEGVDLLATHLEVQGGMLTGKFKSKNCYGKEKVRRIRENFDLTNFDYVYAYGDSRGDIPMLDIANERFYKGKVQPSLRSLPSQR